MTYKINSHQPGDIAEEWRDQYVRDDNTRWIPRDTAEARRDFQEAIELHDKPSVLRSIITRLFL